MYTGMYHPSLYQPKASPPAAPIPNSYPVHPDVKLKKLPFYELLGELLKPSSLGKMILQFYFVNDILMHL